MQTKVLQTETMDLTDEDYRAAMSALYRKYVDELRHHESKYKDWSQTAEIYAMSKIDGSGRPVPANVAKFNETVVERRKLSIMIKFLRNEVDFIEKFWVGKGFDLEELRTSVKQKTLLKTNPIVKPKEQVAEAETKKPEKQKEQDPHKILITVKSEPPVSKPTVKSELVKDVPRPTSEHIDNVETVEEQEDEFDESAVEWVQDEVEDDTNIEGNNILSAIEGDDDD